MGIWSVSRAGVLDRFYVHVARAIVPVSGRDFLSPGLRSGDDHEPPRSNILHAQVTPEWIPWGSALEADCGAPPIPRSTYVSALCFPAGSVARSEMEISSLSVNFLQYPNSGYTLPRTHDYVR